MRIAEAFMPQREKEKAGNKSLPFRISSKSSLREQQLLLNFADVCANDAQVSVAVTGVSTVGVSSTVSASLELTSAL